MGTLAEVGRRNAVRTLRRLDEEEEAAGLSW